MRYIKDLEIFLESNTNKKGNTNLVTNIVVGMLLINPEFLDKILDKGQRSRYTHNNSVFLNDLKNLVVGNNRLKLGMKVDKEYIEDDNSGKVNAFFNEYSNNFDMEKDWSKLSKARDIARNIQDKLTDGKLSESDIKAVYWTSPNKEKKEKEDIVIELNDGKQYPLIINSKLNLSKTQSFNTLIDLMLDQQSGKLFTDQYLSRWDKLTQEWFKLIYNNSKKEYKLMIDQFIDATRADSLTYFDYFDIGIQNEKYKHLGQYFRELGKNYKELSNLLTDIWKKGHEAIENFDSASSEWYDLKKVIMNNKIIEHLIIDSLNNLISTDDVEESEDGFLIAQDKVKMRLLRVMVNLMGVEEMDVYYCGKTDFYHIPSRQWFRDNYERFNVSYDYHQDLSNIDSENEEESVKNDSQFRIKLELDDRTLMSMELFTGFSGGEMSGKLNTKMKVKYVPNFNQLVSE